MKSPGFVIFADDRHWHLAAVTDGAADKGKSVQLEVVEVPPDQDPAVTAQAVADRMRDSGYRGEPTVLGVPSDWCLAARVSTRRSDAQESSMPKGSGREHQPGPAVSRRRIARRDALLYRLEEQVPLEAEETVGDFVPGPAEQALGVCCATATLAPVILGLEQAGVCVQHVCPSALLALPDWDARADDATIAVLGFDDAIDVIFRSGDSGGAPVGWKRLPACDAVLKREIRAWQLTNASAASGDLDPSSIAKAGSPANTNSSGQAQETLQAAARVAASVLDGTRQPWVELRIGALAPQDTLRRVRAPLAFVTIALVLLLLTTAAGLLWRANRYDRLAADARGQQVEVFSQTFPGAAIPVDVTSRLAAEERRWRGLSGGGGGDAKDNAAEMHSQVSALALLQQTLAALPADLRFRVDELRWESGKLYLEGQARSHGDAEALAAALRKNASWMIDAPRSEKRDEKSVSFTLTGSIGSVGSANGGREP